MSWCHKIVTKSPNPIASNFEEGVPKVFIFRKLGCINWSCFIKSTWCGREMIFAVHRIFDYWVESREFSSSNTSATQKNAMWTKNWNRDLGLFNTSPICRLLILIYWWKPTWCMIGHDCGKFPLRYITGMKFSRLGPGRTGSRRYENGGWTGNGRAFHLFRWRNGDRWSGFGLLPRMLVGGIDQLWSKFTFCTFAIKFIKDFYRISTPLLFISFDSIRKETCNSNRAIIALLVLRLSRCHKHVKCRFTDICKSPD